MATDQLGQKLEKRLPKTGKTNEPLKKHLQSVTKSKIEISNQRPFIVQSNVKILDYISPLKIKKTSIIPSSRIYQDSTNKQSTTILE